MMSDDKNNSWKSAKYREGITRKLEEALRESGRMPFITSSYIENLIFEDASNKDEYLNYVAKWILQLRAPPRAVTPEQNPYLPSILHLTLPQRTVTPEDTLQGSISQAPVANSKPHSTAQEFSPQPARSDVEWQKPVREESPQNSERPSEIRRSSSKIKKRPKKKNWKSEQFRQNMISKLNAAMERSGVERNITSADIEGLIFKNAKTKDEYLDNVAKWILRIGDK